MKITVMFSCIECGLVDAVAKIDARTEEMSLKEWVETKLNPTLDRQHTLLSLFCRNSRLSDVKIPISNKKDAAVGNYVDYEPPKGPLKGKGDS